MGSVVVGAALIRDGRVLAARRTRPSELAGRWELPGGKVEPGEAPAAALVREVQEELGLRVALTAWLKGEVPVREGLGLRVGLVVLDGADDAWTPYPREHDRLRWLDADELDAVDWLDSDRPFLEQVRTHLAPTGGPR